MLNSNSRVRCAGQNEQQPANNRSRPRTGIGPHSGPYRRRPRRRGILLLVCLSMLALFSVTIVTYLITARQAKRVGVAAGKIEQYGNPPQQIAHRALLDLLRGSRDPGSPLRYDSLLEDLYGNDHVFGELAGAWTAAVSPFAGTNGQILDLTIQPQVKQPVWLPMGVPRARWVLSELPNYYGGAILTFTTGPAAGRSTRILEYTPASGGNPAHLYIQAFDRDALAVVASGSDARPPRFLINGRANNGTGLGFNPTSGLLDYQNSTVNAPQALLPRYTVGDARAYEQALVAYLNSQPTAVGLSLSDEGYDAVDHQNMYLAMLVPTPGSPGAAAVHERTPLTGSYVPVPSFHRPDLIRYWAQQANVASEAAFLDRNQPPNVQAIARRVSFRPIHQSPRFHAMNPRYEADPTWNQKVDNSNPALQVPLAPPWDVDNDGDGLTDSVWIDMGYPVQTSPDGRQYKPLVAILCTDLDGRLNLNAHGSLAQADDTVGAPNDNYRGAANVLAADNRFPRGGQPAMITTFGLGFGPADVNLGVLFASVRDYRALLQGTSPNHSLAALSTPWRVPGRYGELADNDPSRNWNGPQAGLAGVGALLKTARWGHYPHRRNNTDFCFADFASDVSSFGSAPDLWGTGFVGVDSRGSPLYRGAGGWNYDGTAHWNSPRYYHFTRNNPYQIDLSRSATRASASLAQGGVWSSPLDAPFTVYELERLLRYQDRDAAALPNRLTQLAGPTFTGTGPAQAAARQMVTTDSWDLPSASIQLLPELANFLPGKQALTLADLLLARMRAADQANFNPALVPLAIRFYFAPEVLLGQKFNLNRSFGDGQDSNNNGVVDEPIPTEVNNDTSPVVSQNEPGGYLHRHNNGQLVGPGDNVSDVSQRLQARQIYARQLYVLAMLVSDTINGQLPGPSPNTATTGTPQLRTARALAQWAVNVVDFCDRDSIMTYFEYDPQPFTDENGDGHPWDMDGVPNPFVATTAGAVRERRNEVWGCERPELLITETYASHDRRTRDTKEAGAGYTTANGTPPNDRDTHVDQIRRPQGNLVVELYNPQSPSDSPSRDLYIDAGQGGQTDLLSDGPRNNFGLNLAAAISAVGPAKSVSPVWRLAVATQQASGALNQPNVAAPLFLSPNQVERVAYFVLKQGVSDGLSATTNRFFVASNPVDLKILPGHYAVVAPSPRTAAPADSRIYLGSRARITDQTLENNHPAYLRFRTDVDSVGIPGAIATPQRKRALPVLIAPLYMTAAGAEASEAAATRKLRFSVSEPTNGYAFGPDNEKHDDDRFFGSPQDVPFDDPAEATTQHVLTDPYTNKSSDPFRLVCLQRLANPLLPYDHLTNPYITVDSQIVDLAVYSSEEDSTKPDGNGPTTLARLNVRQRGSLQTTNLAGPNVWSQTSTAPAAPQAAGDALQAPLQSQTFGYLNKTYGAMGNQPFPYNGDPATPFPWFPWNNRPFASHMELLLVPRGNPASMLLQHGVRGQAANFNPYAANNNQQAEFTHLLGFFDAAPDGTLPMHLYRLLEFVHAPSRFAGTETILDGSLLVDPNNTAADLFHLRPPFNVLSRYREPGKINLNTVFNVETWRALLGAPPLGRNPATDQWVQATWAELVTSRRGYAPAGPSNDLTLSNVMQSGALPSYTSNPFRSYAGGHLSPTGQKPGIEATLLRSTALLSPGKQFASEGNPLLSPRSSTGGAPLDAPHRNPVRNPYFRYQTHEKLGSLATTRSNVFAVWLTVGYFEATTDIPNGATPEAYPDGYWLGAELGSDTGQVNRHRAFYLIDRTQAAAFEPGEDHNVEQTILLRRLIE